MITAWKTRGPDRVRGLASSRRALSVLALTALMMCCGVATAIAVPTQFLFSGQVGWNVDATKVALGSGATQQEKNICLVESGDECQLGEANEGPGGFFFAESVAEAPDGDVYVADKVNHRVQELGQNGAFVSMFGWNVNKTKVALGAGATQQEKDVCTAVSGDTCGEGEAGTGLAGQLSGGQDVAVDPVSRDVYVLDFLYERVEEYTEDGAPVLMIGREVNETKTNEGAPLAERNVCTVASGDTCQAGTASAGGSTEHGGFKTETTGYGTLLAVGGPDDLLYVADEGRVQKFEASGKWAGQIPPTGLASSGTAVAVAVDAKGDVYVANSKAAGIHEYNDAGALQSCVIDAASTEVHAIALDPFGRLGVIDWAGGSPHGAIYATTAGACGNEALSQFTPPSGPMHSPRGLAFGASDEAYVVKAGGFFNNEIELYAPVRFPEVVTCPAEKVETTGTTLCGEINPEELLTTGRFEYGTSPALGSTTAKVFEGEGDAFELVLFPLAGLLPNQGYYFRVVADATVKGKPGAALGEILQFRTSTPPPAINGSPEAAFVTSQTAVVSALLDPEHAATAYRFEYGPCAQLAGCSEILSTDSGNANHYGSIGVTAELEGLIPQSLYSYRLVADNGFVHEGQPEGGVTEGEEGHFTTQAAPNPGAQTGPYHDVTATSAVITGMVDPDGQPATYTFELGVYNGSLTSYGSVSSGSLGASDSPLEEAFQVTGLQPGTEYAYRIAISGGYVKNPSHTVQGAPATFVTPGLQAVLAVPGTPSLLAFERIPFPTEGGPKCKRGYTKDKHGKCVKQKPKKKKKKARKAKKGKASKRVRGSHRRK